MVCAQWCTTDDINACGCADLSDDDAQTGIDVASDVLYRLSGERFPGVCTATVRPVMPAGAGITDRYLRTYVIQHAALPWAYEDGWGCAHGFGCACGCYQQVRLGPGPIVSITSVTVDGTVLAPADYDVLDSDWLVRVDGGAFPSCQDPRLPSTEDGTFEVVYTFGQAPPPSGVIAAAKLACEISKACAGGECALPERVTSLVRQGVSMTLLDPQTFLDNGRTGIYLVDLFLAAYPRDTTAHDVTIQSPDYGPLARRRLSDA